MTRPQRGGLNTSRRHGTGAAPGAPRFRVPHALPSETVRTKAGGGRGGVLIRSRMAGETGVAEENQGCLLPTLVLPDGP